MNNAIYRAGHLQNIITLDNNVLERAEILFGPSSTVYGSDALGGVIHFYTRNPELAKAGEGLKFGGNAFARYGSANNEMTGHVDFTLAGQKFGSLTSFTFSDFGDLRSVDLRRAADGVLRVLHEEDHQRLRRPGARLQRRRGWRFELAGIRRRPRPVSVQPHVRRLQVRRGRLRAGPHEQADPEREQLHVCRSLLLLRSAVTRRASYTRRRCSCDAAAWRSITRPAAWPTRPRS